MKVAYYPGCTQRGTAEEFGHSTEAACEALGIELAEIPDWNCCGATSAHALDHALAIALPARDLAQAESMGLDTVTTSCAAALSKSPEKTPSRSKTACSVASSSEYDQSTVARSV